MDTTARIREQVKRLNASSELPGLDSVVHHIERAELYYRRGRDEHDDALFNDVVYRTNQAYEGILKEAYALLTGNNPSNKMTHQIEQAFNTGGILKARVLELFTNYRQNWRNESTHDYNLFLSEQEAFLAIVNVSAFVSILLDQMVERVSYLRQQELSRKRAAEVLATIPQYDQLPLSMKLANLLIRFTEQYQQVMPHLLPEFREFEILGTVEGFLQSTDPALTLTSQPQIRLGQAIMRPDLLVKRGEEQAILELKKMLRLSPNEPLVNRGDEQLLAYLGCV